MGPVGVPELLIILMIGFCVVLGAVLFIWPAARVLKRIGFSPWLSLVCLIPLGSIVLLWIVAYSDWHNVKASSRE